MKFPNLTEPYDKVERDPIQYTYCVDYNHISRYKGLRQIIREGNQVDRYIALETVNPIESNVNMKYYTVPAELANRLDVIAYQQLGSAHYAWVIAYLNKIPDGYTVLEGTVLRIPVSLTSLFNKGEVLAPISVQKLHLGSE